MNEQQVANRLQHFLNLGAASIDRRTADRLYAARQRALARHNPGLGVSLVAFGHLALDQFLPVARTLVALIALAVAVAGISLWNSIQHAADLEEIDSALLTDELPIDAYLDRGFDTWLRHSSEQ